ncbi:23S rRNA mA1618 methyltransferase [Ewingella americana]|uniref:23S rRNA mA1618 methyltransferase n=1 Tax=Ewingella americana TaxID=41202 RepID=A0A377NF81_9GAMM|nr:23S rRNA mA1618 methyltransferase [Ewingella americana]
MEQKKIFPQEKSGLHPRNRHRSRYDFPALIASSRSLARSFLKTNGAICQ